MTKTALEDVSYELIKTHILDPENSMLTPAQQELLDRVISASKVLDRNPVMKNAISLHLAKYPDISRNQGYKDLRMAVRLFNTLQNFDYDFWQTWLINDIVRNIDRARSSDNPAALRVIAMEHSNLIKAIGERPTEMPDPAITEKHDFYLLINMNNEQIKLDHKSLRDLPEATRRELTRALFAGAEVIPEDAIEIMKT